MSRGRAQLLLGGVHVLQQVFVTGLGDGNLGGEALVVQNAKPFGLQAGVFPQIIDRAFSLARQFDVRGATIDDTPNDRADLMPYDGVKESGYGVEGPYSTVRVAHHCSGAPPPL